MNTKILITGGWGYLGGRIAVTLAEKLGWPVRLSSRQPRPQSPAWLPQAETVCLDLLRPQTFAAALAGVTAVVHLAAMNENDSLADPVKADRINTKATADLLDAAIKSGIKRFVYFSTAHVYGSPLVGNITEASIPRPVHPYAISHYQAEKFVLAAQAQGRIEGIVVRTSNGFGAPTHIDVDRWTLLVNDLCRQAVQNRKLVLHSSGLQQRDFVTLHDIAKATGHFLRLPADNCADGLFNLGGECSMSIWEMTQAVSKCCRDILGEEVPVVRPQPLPGEGAAGLRYDISKLKQTGFTLEGDRDQEIRDTLKICLAQGQPL